jgi:hypothetical protein
VVLYLDLPAFTDEMLQNWFKTVLTFTGPIIFVAVCGTNLSDGIQRDYSWTFKDGNVY